MFTEKEFAILYQMLDLSFFNVLGNIDCGSTQFSTCKRFCCVDTSQRTTPIKWLLPNEQTFLKQNHFHQYANIQPWDYMFVYVSLNAKACACEKIRQYRPFCCRIFPFRPVLDPINKAVLDVARNNQIYFSQCWLNYPSLAWKKRAIQAWQFVLSDLDNLCFFARLYLVIEQSEKKRGLLFSEALKDPSFSNQINALPHTSLDTLWHLSSKYFVFSLS